MLFGEKTSKIQEKSKLRYFAWCEAWAQSPDMKSKLERSKIAEKVKQLIGHIIIYLTSYLHVGIARLFFIIC